MKKNPTTFRPTPANEKKLELASKLGLEITKVINEALDNRIDDILRKRSREVRSALEEVPA